MPGMKFTLKIAMISCSIFIANSIHSQELKTLITFSDGETKEGIINLESISDNVILLKNGEKYIKIIPEQVVNIKDTNDFNIYVEEININNERKKIFIRTLISSTLSLFEGNIKRDEKVFYIYDHEKSNNRIKLNNTGFLQQLKALYPNCNIKRRIIYNKDELSASINEINKCINPANKVLKYRDKLKIGIDAGLSYSYFMTNTVETGWYGPSRLKTKDFDPIISRPFNVFVRTYLGNRFIVKTGISYSKYSLNNDSLRKSFRHDNGIVKIVLLNVNFDITKIKVPVIVGYNFKLSNNSSLIFETGSSITVFNKFKMNKDFKTPYTSSENKLQFNSQTMHIQAYISVRQRLNNIMFEPFVKYEYGSEKIDTINPDYRYSENFTNIRLGRYEYGFAISYRLKKTKN